MELPDKFVSNIDTLRHDFSQLMDAAMKLEPKSSYALPMQPIGLEEWKPTWLRCQWLFRPQIHKVVLKKRRQSRLLVIHSKLQRTKPRERKIRLILKSKVIPTAQARRKRTLDSGTGKTMGGDSVKDADEASWGVFQKRGPKYFELKEIEPFNCLCKKCRYTVCTYF